MSQSLPSYFRINIFLPSIQTSPLGTWKINAKYLQEYKLTKKEDKHFRKTKFADFLFADIPN